MRNFIRLSLEQFFRNEGFNTDILYHEKLAGVDFHKIDWTNHKTSIGYRPSTSYQGKRLMTKTCYTPVGFALNDLDLNRVEVHCANEKKKSLSIPERLGFAREGFIRQDEWLYDHLLNLVVYGMLASKWQELGDNVNGQV